MNNSRVKSFIDLGTLFGKVDEEKSIPILEWKKSELYDKYFRGITEDTSVLELSTVIRSAIDDHTAKLYELSANIKVDERSRKQRELFLQFKESWEQAILNTHLSLNHDKRLEPHLSDFYEKYAIIFSRQFPSNSVFHSYYKEVKASYQNLREKYITGFDMGPLLKNRLKYKMKGLGSSVKGPSAFRKPFRLKSNEIDKDIVKKKH